MNDPELRLGIFARVFPPASPAALAQTVRSHGLSLVQLNLVAVGLPTIPSDEDLVTADLRGVGEAFRAAGVDVWGVSATYNMADPDVELRRSMTRRAAGFLAHARALGARHVTLCTGTRDPDDKWRAHPDNSSPEAWSDMLESFEVLIESAVRHDVVLAVEPEPGNIVCDVAASGHLLDLLGDRSAVVRFILDPANLVSGHPPDAWANTIDEAFATLGDLTVCIHAKDVIPWASRLAGAGGIDFGRVMRRRKELSSEVPVIIQDTEPEEVRSVMELLRSADSAR